MIVYVNLIPSMKFGKLDSFTNIRYKTLTSLKSLYETYTLESHFSTFLVLQLNKMRSKIRKGADDVLATVSVGIVMALVS